MRIERTSATTISPRTLETLLHRRSLTFYNAERGFRQPLGIYNLSLSRILESFREVLDELDNVLKLKEFELEPPIQWAKKLVRRQEDLVDALMRHFDDCFNLLRCFYPLTHQKLEEDEKQVKRLPDVRAVMDTIKPYRDHISNIMNHMKHHQGALRGVVIFNEKMAIPGYFVERVAYDHSIQEEVIEPHPSVHPPFRGQATAFSFFRDLRYKFWLLYAVSEDLADVIEKISSPTPSVIQIVEDTHVIEIAERISKMPLWIYEDEALQDFPYVGIARGTEVTILLLEYPSQRTILPARQGADKVLTGWLGDGTTRSFKPPYYNP
ncbi:MAG: hypothetical protein KF726_05015 [Anaerolineae bacterium]|nr:hypothetical protein [Anaerolineae bacterium]